MQARRSRLRCWLELCKSVVPRRSRGVPGLVPWRGARRALALGGWVVVSSLPQPAAACGGLFCSQFPVDQSAERILFEVNEDTVTMTTQIQYAGSAEDFAWILPLPVLPSAESLAVFPALALLGLDAATQPQAIVTEVPCIDPDTGQAYADSRPDPSVQVLLRAQVGEYEVAGVSSDSPAALIRWLRENGYRVTAAMQPYLALYTREGLSFLALKLRSGADVSGIQPFRFTLPGSSPSIPLRMTAVAARPEMPIVVFVLSDTRFEGKNWPNLAIADGDLRIRSWDLSGRSNWPTLVARAVDAAGGQGWVTDYAGSTAPLLDEVRWRFSMAALDADAVTAAESELQRLFDAYPYMTRLYTRLSPEEMRVDPVLGRRPAADVSLEHRIEALDRDDGAACSIPQGSDDPCDHATCGAGGLCRAAFDADGNPRAGCACVPGATAQAAVSPEGTLSAICQDGRLSFMNPGESETPGGQPFPDPCVATDCGEHGRCAAVNLVPTCVCDQGYVAVPVLSEVPGSELRRLTLSCDAPDRPIPESFYAQRLLPLPPALPGGRPVVVAEPRVDPASGRIIDPLPLATSSGLAAGSPFPLPRPNPDRVLADLDNPEFPPGPPLQAGRGSGCALSPGAAELAGVGPMLVALLSLARRRRNRASASAPRSAAAALPAPRSCRAARPPGRHLPR